MLVYLDGQLVPHDRARVSVFDRGFIFGDGLYEGLRAFVDPGTGRRRVVALHRHVRRMQRGLGECRIDFDAGSLAGITESLLDATGLNEAFVYWHVTRGTPPLDGGPVRGRVPSAGTKPTVFAYASPLPALDFAGAAPGMKTAAIEPDLRWQRGHIKSVSLVAGVLAALHAHERHGADEAVLVREMPDARLVSEGTYTNVVIAKGGRLATPALGEPSILPGVTREVLLAVEPGLDERRITLDELLHADEVMLVGSTTNVSTVTTLDGRELAKEPGPAARALSRKLMDALLAGREDIAGPTGGEGARLGA